MRRHAIWLRAGLGAFAVLALAAVVQFFVLRAALWHELARHSPQPIEGHYRELISDRFRAESLLALALPPIVGSIGALVVMLVMVRRRTAPLVRALERVAKGDFDAELPPPPERDLDAIRDAFERMRVALKDAMRRLEHGDAQRRRLFADLAHELGTPITSQMGLVDVLRGTRGESAEERARLLDSLERETARLTRLVGDLRDLAMLDDPDIAIERAPADVGEIVTRALDPLRTQPGPAIELVTEEARAEIDATRIEQVALNLTLNARRHAPTSSIVRVTVAREGDAVVLTLQDEGPGVPPELLSRLGERLLRIDPSRDRRTGGHGLGLSIVHAIVTRHGGAIAFANRASGGLEVQVRLPALPR